MSPAWALLLALLSQTGGPERSAFRTWAEGDRATGDWGGVRSDLTEHGVTVDLSYSVELFLQTSRLVRGEQGVAVLGHADAALTVETEKLGLWRGGKLYVLGQSTHGVGINTFVGSATSVSNLEAEEPFTQLTELFYEHSLFDDRLVMRVGKQDANRDFGTPRYGGNFLNNNFGMYPTTPLPSYPTTGLGAVLVVKPLSWLSVKAAVYEGSPAVGSFGIDSALAEGAGVTAVAGLAADHRFGEAHRSGGTTSLGVWHRWGELPAVGESPDAETFSTSWGLFVQNDEQLFAHPEDAKNASGLTLITRFAWSQPDRTEIALYGGASLAWHGLGPRDNDTVGIGFGAFTVAGRGVESFVEAFYKLRLTNFFSLQPDVMFYRRPGGDGPNALVCGVRAKVKL